MKSKQIGTKKNNYQMTPFITTEIQEIAKKWYIEKLFIMSSSVTG
jgi:hypothetical protein